MQHVIEVNAQLRSDIESVAASAHAAAAAAGACNASAALATRAVGAVRAALVHARTVADATVQRGHELQAQVAAVVDGVGRAENVTSCAWVLYRPTSLVTRLVTSVMDTVARAREGVRNTSGIIQKRQARGGAHLGLHHNRHVSQVGTALFPCKEGLSASL